MDLRQSLNAISDVIVNRPPPLRRFDQIYMKAADMLIQAEHVSKWLDDRDTLFIGDGDALALCLVHLLKVGQLARGPKHIHILDFDERVVNSVSRFAERYGYRECISAALYNVADPLPDDCRARFTGFYSNPPFGSSNNGNSVAAFLLRGLEGLAAGGVCCAVLADDQELSWCNGVLQEAQRMLIENGCVISELVPEMHTYHLDDHPNLRSCSLIARRLEVIHPSTLSYNCALRPDWISNFYGANAALDVQYVRDLTNGGKLSSHDIELVPRPR
jgi:N4-bis(aminopropyl)spermidine synthase